MTIEEERSNLYEDDPEESEQYLEIREDQANVAVASFWQLIWWRYRRHRVAVFSTFVVLIFYLIAAFSEFVAPYDPEAKFVKYKLHPPTAIHIVDAEGNWHMPFHLSDRARAGPGDVPQYLPLRIRPSAIPFAFSLQGRGL